jgi:signal peptidase I
MSDSPGDETTGAASRRGSARRLPRDLLSVAAASMVVLTARATLADHYSVPSGSMLPTVHIGDRVLVDKSAYGLRVPLTSTYLLERGGPARGDVVVLESPETGIVLLKRVAAVPGDRVEVRDGQVWLSGVAVPLVTRGGALQEALGAEPHPVAIFAGGPDFGPTVIPRDRYLVLGDNRDGSHDGRSFGLVERRAILGRAERVYLRDGSPSWIDL